MQLGIQDIRDFGFKKISSKYFSSENERKYFIDKVMHYNAENASVKQTSFGFLAKWNKVEDKNYIGIFKFAYNVEPLIDNIKVDEISKRRFRNVWESLWKNYCKVMGFNENVRANLQDWGIRMAFTGTDSIDESVLEFYNAILIWHVLTQSETSLAENHIKFLDLLDLMCNSDKEEFVSDFIFSLI